MTTIDNDFKAFIAKSDEDTVFSIAKEFLSVEQVESLLLQLDEDTKTEILENFEQQ